MILIDMNMPKSCSECVLRYRDTEDNDFFRFRCKVTDEQIQNINERDIDCPLKESEEKE